MPSATGPTDEDAAREVIVALCAAGPFERAEAERALDAAGITTSTERVLELLSERQTMVRLGGEPPRWELVID